MGAYYFHSEPVFHAAILRCDEILTRFLPISLLEVLYPSQNRSPNRPSLNNNPSLDDALCTQAALFSVQYAMAELWMSRGVCPDVVMGVGVGELVAATVAGVMGFEDSIQLVAQKANLFTALPSTNGVMVACRVG